MEITRITIANGINKLLKIKKMTQGDIVRATGLERSYVSKLASGKIPYPRIDTVYRIAKAFGMTISEFLIHAMNGHGPILILKKSKRADICTTSIAQSHGGSSIFRSIPTVISS